jgi:hypothetical protein
VARDEFEAEVDGQVRLAARRNEATGMPLVDVDTDKIGEAVRAALYLALHEEKKMGTADQIIKSSAHGVLPAIARASTRRRPERARTQSTLMPRLEATSRTRASSRSRPPAAASAE